jgi:hypothetical protein
MNSIGELLERDLGRKIEEIIQVDQADEQSASSSRSTSPIARRKTRAT